MTIDRLYFRNIRVRRAPKNRFCVQDDAKSFRCFSLQPNQSLKLADEYYYLILKKKKSFKKK